ncbi:MULTISPECIES: TetR/AcrR family transcriptional regulator [Paracoccus]|jgi:AcrR family transcriptional regulator|uniref:Transcriptional regulator, TetR family n=1 Tax=Paracoccus denitrificans (strain Pd 1222) TaxID=318586 RepID=A1B5Y7_PARDP|nr:MULTISPECIES: TetR/AcrR family transcriptional regulator [Paracoccus]ABL70931.1 transcriptional regulator, TetR family [Paracoccus denitrificans PD1222]MBB4626586.1 AcrR family transcriptional regulator [Paracoccus denitrificans]MCU7428771.1 TetR/AcrR family transcriptional regulator [Paracoccus denitrificans]MDK8872906.1 TetR/AcrR family transcriptional regulator [Paracoccus sp. SSJ]QAR27609.1 TetR/AcrR family transcriptional regulator [Paracoccus denitrificans]
MARSSYHHGNLRQALVEATVQLIEERGPQAFTLAEAARLAGVSAAAPYRHFAGREDLLEEVARQGFEEFADRLEAAFDEGRPRPLTAFLRMGQEYLTFAAERRGFYMAMFEAGLSIAGNAGLSQASERARGILVRGAEALFAQLPAGRRPPPGMVADHIWALSHGVVELFGRGKPGSRSPISPADMLESGALIYLRGLGVIRD